MTFTLAWEESAIACLKRLPSWQVAARVCRAMIDFAATGRGDVRRVGHSQEFRLHVAPYVVRFSVNAEERVLMVWTVFRLG